MSFDYEGIKVIVQKVIPEFGIKCSAEITIDGDYNPDTGINGEVIKTQGHCVLTEVKEIYGEYNNLIEVGDQTALSTSTLELKIGSIMLIDGERYEVINPAPVKPANKVVLYKAHVRKL